MAMSGGKDDGSPMMDLNMTPMIDVLLVLLILFIMTIPAQTHAVKVDLPVNSNQPAPPVEPQKNKIIIYADDRMTWNGTEITSDAQLEQYLEATKQILQEQHPKELKRAPHLLPKFLEPRELRSALVLTRFLT